MTECPYKNNECKMKMKLLASIFGFFFIFVFLIICTDAQENLIISCGGNEELVIGCLSEQDLSGLGYASDLQAEQQTDSSHGLIISPDTASKYSYGILFYFIGSFILLACLVLLIAVIIKKKKQKVNYYQAKAF